MTIEDVIKQIKEAQEAMTKAHSDNQAGIKSMVEETIRTVLRSHPGVTPERKVIFDGAMPSDESALTKMLPSEVQHAADNLFLLSKFLKKDVKQLKSYGDFRRMFDAKATEFRKALDSTTAGGVDEWVPTDFSAQLKEKVRLQLKVAALFPTISMPSNPYTLPVEVGNIDSFLQPENTADTGQTIIPVGDTSNISGSVTFSASGHATRVLMSKEAMEDSIVPLLPLIQSRIVLALAQGREDVLMNGDNSVTHMDSDTAGGSAQLRRKMAKGIRALGYLNSYTTDLSTLSLNNLIDMVAAMGVYGINPADTAFVTGISGAAQLMKIDAVQTLDKFGPQAVVLQGQIGFVLGRPLVVSEYQRTDLNGSGVYASASTKTTIALVNRNGIGIGERSRVETQLLTELYAVYNQNALIASERFDIQPLYPIASNRVVQLGVNVG